MTVNYEAALIRQAAFPNPELVSYRDNYCGCAIGTIYNPATEEDVSVSITCVKHNEPNLPTCEDCGEATEDVAVCTEPVRSNWQDDPPDSAELCSGCHDRRLHPRDSYDGPDRRGEDE